MKQIHRLLFAFVTRLAFTHVIASMLAFSCHRYQWDGWGSNPLPTD